jgi:hypothetical protein
MCGLFTLKEGCELRVTENRILRRMLVKMREGSGRRKERTAG